MKINKIMIFLIGMILMSVLIVASTISSGKEVTITKTIIIPEGIQEKMTDEQFLDKAYELGVNQMKNEDMGRLRLDLMNVVSKIQALNDAEALKESVDRLNETYNIHKIKK